MSEKEAHDLCIGRAFNQRKESRRELEELEKKASNWGEWLHLVSRRLMEKKSYQVTKEQNVLVFRTADKSAYMLVDEDPRGKPRVPTTDELTEIFGRMMELREKIDELNTILRD